MLHKSLFISLLCAAALTFSSCGSSGSKGDNSAANQESDNLLTTSKIFTYEGKPVSPLLGSSIDEVINALGEPLGKQTDDKNITHRIDYDGLSFWFDDGIFVRAESFEISSKLAIDGVALDKNREELINALGAPEKEGREEEGFYGSENVFVMKYRLSKGMALLEFEEDVNVPPNMINVQ